jgi:serine/threonine-protein phosphatase PPG1
LVVSGFLVIRHPPRARAAQDARPTRLVRHLPPTAGKWFTDRRFWETASVDLDECISRLYKKELLAESVIEAICAKTKELLMRESNVVHVRAPVTVVGDIHGQFFDLIEIFKIGGWCPDTNYLFLGTLSLLS